MKTYKTYLNWSTGKDAALALYYLLQDKSYQVEKLVTTINSSYNRVTMHGLPITFIEKQAHSIAISFATINLPEQPIMDDYNEIMNAATSKLKEDGFTHATFGDILLEDLRDYREKQLGKHHITAVFPLWKRNMKELMQEFLDLGFKAIIECADSRYFTEDFVGKIIDEELLANLPKGVDPCGENCEFHTFCFDGPIFKTPITFNVGEKIYREYPKPNAASDVSGFWFCNLIPN
ncbi:adenine nucleotide alpha hydrolase [Bizionia myxarmorum]|uniref:Adenine nucleotide alpha hydrolase n=1 Tax=Bizionia myxarmorum TaxID=291186 RepID=A0A5D0R6U7_9FLAO|nr:adenine nucleotide alpha hydrolase [Bizionia myxarmorum]TYB77197.1 adenine nucleotide alpha hydrolase [Bizionia myxarmorum]